MPVMHVTILEGRSDEQKEAFFAGVTQVAAETLNVKPEAVRVILNEVPKKHFAAGGIPKSKS